MENKGFIKEVIHQFMGKGDAVAFALYDGVQVTDITYTRFVQDILKAAGYFKEHKIHQQHIALSASNSYACVITYFAISASGNTAVLVNPMLPLELIQEQCEMADTSVICAEALPEAGSNAAGLRWLTFSELTSEESVDPDEIWECQPDETVLMLCTSGTTGKSKVVEVSSDNLKANFASYPSADEIKGVDRQLLVLPMFHISGMISVMTSLVRGKTMCIGRGMRYIFADLPVFKPTFISLVPAMMESLEKIYKGTNEEERAKRLGGNIQRICVIGAASKAGTCQYLMEQGLILETGYGMTESVGVGTWGEFTPDTIRSIGKLCKNVEAQFRDGELLLKGKSVMKGYYKDPEETAAVVEDGWLHTGDMGYYDANGYYYITGRKKNVIILANGENVNPEEIEAAFGTCEAIEECLVYSDSKGICADVFATSQEDAAAFIKAYNSKMPKYRQVYKVNYTTEPLPKTSSGKIKRKENQ